MIELTDDKTKQLANLEKDIERAKTVAEKHWFEIGKALCKIRDKKLHPQRTFEQYCLQRWGFKRRRAFQLCEAFEITQSALNMQRGAQIPESDKHARALKDVPPEQHTEVLEEAAKSGKVTTESVKKAAAKRKPKPKDVIEKDKIGRDIVGVAPEVWKRRNELRPKLAPLFELKQWAEDMQGSDDIFFRGYDFGKLLRHAGQLIFTLQQALPDVVCTKCQGYGEDPDKKKAWCDLCNGRGMISMASARQNTPIEMKRIINMNSENDSAERLSSASR